jgi:dihydrofolate reductase
MPVQPFKAIAAMSLNRVIGAGNRIPWHLPEDFKWFKRMTTGHVIVMGRKTFESIGKPLPNRATVVLSRRGFRFPGVRVVHDLKELLPNNPSPVLPDTLSPSDGERAGVRGISEKSAPSRDIFICGGAEVYVRALPLCSDLYLTLVKRQVEGDAFFPPFEDQFELVEEIRDSPEFEILHYRAKPEHRS